MQMRPLNNTSILRKFLIIFLLVSIIPLAVLFYLYYQLHEFNQIHLSNDDITVIMLWVILGIVCGFWAMRSMIVDFISSATQGQRALAASLTNLRNSTKQLEINETEQLNQTFKAVTARLEEDRRNLESAKKTLHSVLTKISVGLSSNENINGFMHLITETAMEALNGKIGLTLILDKNSSELQIKSIVGVENIGLHALKFSATNSVFSSVIEHKKSLIISSIEEIQNDSREPFKNIDFPIICAPLLVNNETLGVLAICGKTTTGNFGEEDLSLIYNMALQAGVALNNDELKNLANIDPLTNIFNYRHMAAVLDYETMRLKRYPGNLSLILFDVDGFKLYNDEFGHPEGDKLLISLTDTIGKKLRSSDVFCRYGGDEFAVILPQTALPGALIVANKIKEASENLEMRNKITLSIGGAEWMHPMSRHDLLVKADKALYRAKAQGKDKVLLI